MATNFFMDITRRATNIISPAIDIGLMKTDRIRMTAGSILDPALSFTGDLGTGLANTGAGIIDVVSQNSTVMRITDIGTRIASGGAGNLGLSFINDIGTGFENIGTGLMNFVSDNTLIMGLTGDGIQLTPGTVLAPAISFLTDITTGIANTGAGIIEFVSGGVCQLSIDANTSIVQLNDRFQLSTIIKVIQSTSITTGVTLNSTNGIVVTQSPVLAPFSSATFTVTNSKISPTSDVILSIVEKIGAYGATGIPLVNVNNIVAGAFDIVVSNVDNANNLTGALDIHFIVVE